MVKTTLLVKTYRKVASSNTSYFEAHAGLYQIVYEGDFRCLCAARTTRILVVLLYCDLLAKTLFLN